MNITLISVGKTDDRDLQHLLDQYVKRLSHYVSFEWIIIPDLKNAKRMDEKHQKIKEGEAILKKVQTADRLILLDEKGKQYTSLAYAEWMQKKMNSGLKNLVFVIGGPYGFSEAVYRRSDEKLSFSTMTFSHQMIRLFFVEQVYRAYTILKNEPYHHR
ncbi:23S rRNA (pseudouridine(1915)-N(3))-methyltransferase RlmH [Gangjinia marincola]